MGTKNYSDLDAATSQLRTAIELFFEDRDPVSIHTLISAASDLIERRCKKAGIPSMRDSLRKMIRPDRWKDVEKHLVRPKNFFKHGPERDGSTPGGVLHDFDDDLNMWLLLEAGRCLAELGRELPEARLLAGWASMVEPGIMTDQKLAKELAALSLWRGFTSQPRSEQKQIGLMVMQKIATGEWPPRPFASRRTRAA